MYGDTNDKNVISTLRVCTCSCQSCDLCGLTYGLHLLHISSPTHFRQSNFPANCSLQCPLLGCILPNRLRSCHLQDADVHDIRHPIGWRNSHHRMAELSSVSWTSIERCVGVSSTGGRNSRQLCRERAKTVRLWTSFFSSSLLPCRLHHITSATAAVDTDRRLGATGLHRS